MTDVATNTELNNIELEIDSTKVERSTQTKKQTQTQTQTQTQEEYDRDCSRYSTAGFLLGVFAIVVYGIVTI